MTLIWHYKTKDAVVQISLPQNCSELYCVSVVNSHVDR